MKSRGINYLISGLKFFQGENKLIFPEWALWSPEKWKEKRIDRRSQPVE
jgi:hypothetical protein